MIAVTLYELRQRVRQICDMEGDSAFIQDYELDRYINRGLWALDEVLHLTWEDYYVTTVTLSTAGTSPVTSLNLPQDVYKIVRLDVTVGGRRSQMRAYSLGEQNALLNSASASLDATATRYRITAGAVSFAPPLPAGTPLTISYYPQLPALAFPESSRSYLNGWEEWAVLYAAIRVLTKEERDTSTLEKLWTLEDARVRSSAPVRDVQQLAPGAPGDSCGPYLGEMDRGLRRW